MKGLTVEQAELAAKWWANHLRTRNAKQDHGDRSPTGVVAMGLTKLVQSRAPQLSEEKIQAFEDALIEEFQKERFTNHIAGVDYHPDRPLFSAADRTGVSLDACQLPIKTHMYLVNGEVQVSYGYGAPWKPVKELMK